MFIEGKVVKGRYFDSVFLMKMARTVSEFEGVQDSSVVVGSAENIKILKSAELFLESFSEATGNDLIIVLKGVDGQILNEALLKALELMNPKENLSGKKNNEQTQSLESALTKLPKANLALFSIAGKYVAEEAMNALKQNLHVMLFSDNVSLEDEIKLKTYGRDKGLFVMGPDCGTAIIDGVPLAFANAVHRGPIGVVAASGTGLQEVTCLISNLGEGISQAIGTGGRDIKKEVGGICFLMGVEALMNDPETKVILLVSKPPHEDVMNKITQKVKGTTKPVIALFLGATKESLKETGIHYAENLADAAFLAVKHCNKINHSPFFDLEELKKVAGSILTRAKKGQYLRALYSGGTFCYETQLILNKLGVGEVFSNAPTAHSFKLENNFQSIRHTVLDLGEDEFTVGRPHPMIDFSLRNKRIIEEAKNPETMILLLDLVLGYGAHLNPLADLLPTLKEALQYVPIIVSVTGTDQDPQGRREIMKTLRETGIVVKESNAQAATLAGLALKLKGGAV